VWSRPRSCSAPAEGVLENAHKTGSAFSATSLAQSGRSRQLARREDYDVVDVGNERSTEGR
jgi:hypothetical protein